jgi:membrane associated rhomboid family serine protease/antitoxin component YwqK of YwqJK toxin-antitoxin module
LRVFLGRKFIGSFYQYKVRFLKFTLCHVYLPALRAVRHYPVTLALIVVNLFVYAVVWLSWDRAGENTWILTLLDHGAQFAPLSLGGQFYRVFTHMFLHSNVIHLAVNMYALYVVGSELERTETSVRFVWIYFLSGIGASITSLYWSLFEVGVGASGAIFGLFGYSLLINIVSVRREGGSLIPVLVNFILFVIINLAFAKALNADNAAHMGGLVTGFLFATGSYFSGRRKDTVLPSVFTYSFLTLLLVLFILLPRHQVSYYNFFQYVVDTEDRVREELSAKGLKDAEYLEFMKEHAGMWDSAGVKLNSLSVVPGFLHQDTFRLRRYIALRKLENEYWIRILGEEEYVFMDSIEHVKDSVNEFTRLDYPLIFKPGRIDTAPSADTVAPREMIRVWYDENWEEIPYPGTYFRIGYRDSLQRWQGPVRDYYANGDIQMKGVYKDDQRNGIFIYYSDHKTYASAGQYVNNRSVGKWQIFYDNGKLQREVVYQGPMRLKNLWDTTGAQIVKDGFGKVMDYHPNGVVAVEGEFVNGYREGIWYGRHEDGNMHFWEEYNTGMLVRGKSRNASGKTFTYAQSSFFPRPEGGHAKLQAWLKKEAAAERIHNGGVVKLSFRVSPGGMLSDFEIEQSVSQETDRKAIELLKRGPRWMPATEHGYIPVSGYASMEITFEE